MSAGAPRAAVVGFLAGLWLAVANCGSVTFVPTGTSLLVHVSKHSSIAGDVHGYLFSGEMNGGEAFAETQRPDPIGAPLNGPQDLRVTFSDSFAGQTVTVTAYALDGRGEPVGVGVASGVLALNADVAVDLVVKAIVVEDAGTGGGFDAGTIRSCSCDAGCCFSDGGCARPVVVPLTADAGSTVSVSLCGQNRQTCDALCAFPLANVCVNGGCRCGTNNPCNPGEWCVSSGTTTLCVCGVGTGCNGCCLNGLTCLPGTADDSCGRAGYACVNCATTGRGKCKTTTVGTDNNFGYCFTDLLSLSCSAPDKCLQGSGCSDAGFPVCRANNTARTCYACDLVRSDRCNGAGGCACGLQNVPCGANQFCSKGTCASLLGAF